MGTLSVTTIQTPLHWEDPTTNLAMLEAKIAAAPAATVVVLPEMFNTGFSMRPSVLAETMNGLTVQWMRQMAMQHRVVLCGSLMVAEAGHYFNRLVWMLPTGQSGHYDKRHLFAYAGENEFYTPGQKKCLASVNGWKINLQVCYDLRFPVWSRQQSTDNDGSSLYDLLVYVANWPAKRGHAWRTLLQARAIENQCYVVGVNRVGQDGNGIDYDGDTMVVDPLGTVMYQAGSEAAVATTLLSKAHLTEVRQKFPFWKDGDRFDLAV